MTDPQLTPLTDDELAAEAGIALPDKEVLSLLDLNVNVDLALDLAAPIDLAVAANANVAAPIDAAVGANVLSAGSDTQVLADQGALINQGLHGSATATGDQESVISQGAGTPPATSPTTTEVGDPGDPTAILDGDLLKINVDVNADANLTAPIAGAVAANANVAAPIDAAVGANVASIDSHATAVAQQDAIINQTLDATAQATAHQNADVDQ